MQHYLTTKEASAILGCGPKNVTLLCAAGKFPGAKKVPGKKTDEWRIPAEEVIQYQAQKEVEAEVLPPEGLELVTTRSLESVIAEVISRNQKEHAETRKMIAEIEQRYEEETKRKDEEIAELRGILTRQEEEQAVTKQNVAEVQKEVAVVWGKVTELQNKKPWWAKLLGG